MWDEMVEEYGEERALELLKECKAEIKPGLPVVSQKRIRGKMHGKLISNHCLSQF